MVIEFYTPEGEVKEWIISFVRDAVMRLYRQHKEISRAEVCFRERQKTIHVEKICEIELFILNDKLLITGSGTNFDHAARKAIEELDNIIAAKFNTSEPPDEIVSTVEV
jgi:hypothetical protein